MTVVSAVAGPSRLPYTALRHGVNRVARYASTAAPGNAGTESSDRAEASTDGVADGESGYRSWLKSTGNQFERVRKGQRAIWLGRDVPFPGNPSFRPPPPLSNDLQDIIYQHLRAGSTVSQLSHRYNVSKARIEAIRKLKDVEREFNRQRLPTQDAYLRGMESLLNVRSPLDPISKKADAVRERDEATSRALQPNTDVERVEEDRWQAGIGRGGAFGDRTSQAELEGLERTAWEFRDEETEIREKKAAAQSAASVQPELKEASDEVAAAQAGSDTPEAQRIVDALAHPPSASSRTDVNPSVHAGQYTFVDVSGQAKWSQNRKGKRGKKERKA